MPYIFINKDFVKDIKKEEIKKIADRQNLKTTSKDEKNQNGKIFITQLMNGRLFLYDLLECDKLKNSINYNFPHNAIPMNLSELKDIHDLIKEKYSHAKECLESKHRKNEQLVVQDLHNFYNLNTKNRKINDKIRYRYFDLATKNIDKIQKRQKYDLFCINTGGGRQYTDEQRKKARKCMSKLFPYKTKYEL